jgi:hypothetical protein
MPEPSLRSLSQLTAATRQQLSAQSPLVTRCTRKRRVCLRSITRSGGLINQLQVLDLALDQLTVAKGPCRTDLARERAVLERHLGLLEQMPGASPTKLGSLQKQFSDLAQLHTTRLDAVTRSCRNLRVPTLPPV